MTASDVNLGPGAQSQTERGAALAAWVSLSGLIEGEQRTADEIAFPSSSTSCVSSCVRTRCFFVC